ncbi:MAG: GNAT family N-acyltransferase, partial [Burkholderiaceae bacterium]
AFWLTRLDPLRDALVELGRSCVDPDYRNGTVIRLLWAGLWAWLAERDHRYLLGCASVPMNDGGLQAAALYESLVASSPIDESRRVWPRRRLPAVDHGSIGAFTDAPLQEDPISMPPLVKGYLRAGARVIGEPHHDRAFVCADFPMLLEIDRLSARYRRHFGGH